MALTNAEKHASWRVHHLKNETSTKLRAQFIFDASTRSAAQADRRPQELLVISLIKEWAARAERGSLISSRARR
jgi:hypothetical protein